MMRYLEVANISDSGVPYARLIVDGTKTWEIRWFNTSYRGLIAIIFQKKILGTVKIVDVFAATPEYLAKFKNHKSNYRRLKKYAQKKKLKKLYTWVFEGARKFGKGKEVNFKYINNYDWVKLER